MSNVVTLILFGLVVLAVYVVECAIWPFEKHKKCKGTGRYIEPGTKGINEKWRNCRGCKGSGRKLRTGRRLWNAVQRRKAEGQ